jgi:hypothetical protein
MKRRLVSIAAVLSSLLCVATSVMWVRSHWIGDQLISVDFKDRSNGEGYRRDNWHVTNIRGSVTLFVGRKTFSVFTGNSTSVATGWRFRSRSATEFALNHDTFWNKLGFRFAYSEKKVLDFTHRSLDLAVPH